MRTILTLTALLLLGPLFSQEILTGLQFNPVVSEKAAAQALFLKSGQDTLPMTLPFFDDFRNAAVFPSEERWIDREAFVNTDFPLFPINIGAATLDAINDTGNMYPHAIPGPSTFPADHLTSRYIRLDSVFLPSPNALTPADSVWLSFWYQPQGRGKPPQAADSLLLQFLVEPAHDSITPTDTIPVPDLWATVWKTKGMSLDTFYLQKNRYFDRVMIPVTDSARFFKKTFRFRFMNYVSLASNAEPSWQSNCDQWNIDEVYLDAGRTWTDTIRPEITFIERPPNMLRQYASMPYLQYCDNPGDAVTDTIDVLISNRDVTNHNSSYQYTLTQPGGAFNKTYNGGTTVLKPFYNFGYSTYIPFAHPPVPYLFPLGTSDSASFLITHRVQAEDGSGYGDTISSMLNFFNYYAYDDGTPEAGYGLTPTGSMLACRFTISKPDTLRAIQIYFNRTLSKANVQFFYLRVWNDNNGKPGDIVADTLMYTRFADSLNKFVTYHLSPAVKVQGTFYVGMEQTTDDNLNIGFDRYNNSQTNIFYNSTAEWFTSAYSGSLMIRPVIGEPIPLGIPAVREPLPRVTVYPNPVREGRFRISSPEINVTSGHYTVVVTDLSGRRVFEAYASETVVTTGLTSGFYILTLTDRTGTPVGRCTFIVAR